MQLTGKFTGWFLDMENGLIMDADGNEFTSDEIRGLFYFRQWRSGFEGSQCQIYSLKEQLERKRLMARGMEIEITFMGESTRVTLPCSA